MSDLTRQERFSMSRQFAKELVAGSIITDAAAQFLALMIEEVHNTKIAPLQAELKRRADMLTTLSAENATLRAERDRLATAHKQLMQSLDAANTRADQARDAALVDALTLIVRAHDLRESYHALPNDHHRIGEKRSPKGHAREAWLRAFRKSAKAAAAALAAIKETKT